jgi:hypothetical protein
MLVAVLFANFGPYHLARFQSFQKLCRNIGWEALGIELARQEAEYPWQTEINQFQDSIISATERDKLENIKLSQIIKKILTTLNQVNPDVIAISGYARPAMLASLLWSVWHKKPTILFSESKEDDASRSWWQEQIKTKLVKLYKAALVGGSPHKQYLEKLGMAADAIFSGYDVVGNEVFTPEHLKLYANPINKPYFLAINRFVPKKNLSFLISAYSNYHQAVGNEAWDLVLCGDGKLRSQLEEQIINLGLEKVVHLPGFLQQEELLPYFAHANCFIHASIQEQWGLVVNEAMAAGLPVLVSNRCGCFQDLVIEGINGLGFDPENSQQLTDLMIEISTGKIDPISMGNASLKHIQKFSPDYFAQGLKQAVEYAIAHS